MATTIGVDRRSVYQHVISVEEDIDWLPNNLLSLIKWLTDMTADIPPSYLADTFCNISAVERHNPHAILTIYYLRPETDEEVTMRVMHERELIHAIRRREVAELERLIKKYPDYEQRRYAS